MASMPQILYISGSGRSGSTLLERMLNTSPDVLSVGELHCLWRLPSDAITCSCGKRICDDAFWSNILRRAQIGPEEVAELQRLEAAVVRSSFLVGASFSLEKVAADPRVQTFLALQDRIFSALAAETGARVIVDSSKAGPRGWILATNPNSHILHLYRDPTAVIASWRGRKFDKGLNSDMQRPGVRQAALDWSKVEYLARKLVRVRPVDFVNYATLGVAPRSTVDGILNRLNAVPTPDNAWLDPKTFQPAAPYHSVNGNPDRFDSRPVTVEPRAISWDQHTVIDRLAIRSAGLGLRAAYAPPA